MSWFNVISAMLQDIFDMTAIQREAAGSVKKQTIDLMKYSLTHTAEDKNSHCSTMREKDKKRELIGLATLRSK